MVDRVVKPAMACWRPLTALADRIQRQAPVPGRVLLEGRLAGARLFVLLHNAAQRLGDTQTGDRARSRLIQELTGAFLDYGHPQPAAVQR